MTDIKQYSAAERRATTVRLWLLASGAFTFGTGGFVIAGLLPSIAASFEVDIATASLLITVYALVFAVGAPLLAIVTARVPRTLLIATGLAVGTVGTAFAAFAPTFELMIVARVIGAIGAAVFVPAATGAAAAIAEPDAQGRAVALVTGGFTAATALGAPLGTAIGSIGTWHWSLWFVAGLGAIALAGIVVVLRGIPAPDPLTLRQRFAPLASLRIGAVLVTILLLVAGQYSAYTFFGAVQDRATHDNGLVLSVLLFVYGAAATVGNVAAGSLVDRFGTRRVLNVAVLVLIVAFAVMPFTAATLPGAIVTIAVWGLSAWAALLALQVRVVAVSPGAIAWSTSAVFIGIALSAPLGSFAIQQLGVHYLTLGVAGVVVAAALVGELSHWLQSRHEARLAV
jgi:MFS transporter, DHA1 family, inner membrane transport protein